MQQIPTYIVNNDFDYLKPFMRTQPRTYWLEVYERLRLLTMMTERLAKPEDIPMVAIQTDDVVVDSDISLPVDVLARIMYIQRYGHPCDEEGFDPRILEDLEIELSMSLGQQNKYDQSIGYGFVDTDTKFEKGDTIYAEHNY